MELYLIESGNRTSLLQYKHIFTEILNNKERGIDLDITTIDTGNIDTPQPNMGGAVSESVVYAHDPSLLLLYT